MTEGQSGDSLAVLHSGGRPTARAAVGIRMHSGWGVLVAVFRDAGSLEVIERRRIVVIDPKMNGGQQPYHYAAALSLPEAEKHLTKCAALSEHLASSAVKEVLRKLDDRGYRIAACAVLLASGRPLPPLAKILASHPLIHTAEGEFFRNVVRKACEDLEISVTAIPEREVEERAKTTYGNAASAVQSLISIAGKSIGPPWTKDHKIAALAAMVLAVEESRKPASTRTGGL